MKPSWHYYEAHITLEPVFGDSLRELKDVCTVYNFRVADLLMKKELEDAPELSRTDTFTTGRSDNLKELISRTEELVKDLIARRYDVWRYKIESTVIDSKFEDKLGLLTV